MRIGKFLFLVLILICFISCKKKNVVNPIDAKTSQISKKWRMLEYYVNNVSVKLADGDYLQLNTDKTYTERKYKVVTSGNWDWQENQTRINMNNGTWKILTLSDSHLEIEKMNTHPSERIVLHQF